jgi:hypothetical protein
MALDYFRIGKGVDFDESVQVLYGAADPTAASGVAAGTGSIYMRTNGEVWHKTNTNDTDWSKLVDSAGASLEDGYQNGFTGKTSTGEEYPEYSSENVVTSDSTGSAGDGDNLEEAIGALDAEIGAAVTPEVRAYSPISDQAINLNIEALDAAIGNDAEHTSTEFTNVNESLKTSISNLDAALAASEPYKSQATNQDADPAIAVDLVPVATVSTVEWLLTVKSTTTPANRKTYKIVALNDGTITNIDFTRYAIIKVGGSIAGLSIDVVGASGNMELRVAATENIDYNVSRITLA